MYLDHITVCGNVHTHLVVLCSNQHYSVVYLDRITVKAGTQECGTERGMEIKWLHTGNYTDMTQEVTINAR